MKLTCMLATVGLLMADGAAAHHHKRDGHTDPLDLFTQQTRILTSDRPTYFRVLVAPNLIPRPAAVVTATGVGQRHCQQFGKSQVGLTRVERHSDQDITAWALDFVCR